MSTHKPLHDKVVILPLDNQTTVGSYGLHTPDAAQGHNNHGKVVAVGPGKLLSDGTRAAMQVSVGDNVCYNAMATFAVTSDGVDYKVVSEEQIFTIEVE